MKITQANNQGPRSHMEDRFVIFEDGTRGRFVAVADGHGGSETIKHIVKYTRGTWQSLGIEDIQQRLLKLFELLDAATRQYRDGSTLSAAYIENEGDIHVAVLGDSPVVLHTPEKTWISPEHNVRTNIAEREAAIKRGGQYEQGYIWSMVTTGNGFSTCGPGLQMARALGDKEMGNVLSREPEIFKLEKPKSGFLLLATDGVFDPAHDDGQQAVLDAIKEVGEGTAEDFVNRAVKLKIQDNATAIMVRFDD